MPFTAANHYDFTGDDITGTVDAHRSAGVWAAQLVLSGQTLESTDVTRSDLGFEVRTVVDNLSDGNRTHLLVVLPRVTIDSDDGQPVTFTSYAVLYTVHGGSTEVHGVAESYDVRLLSGTASHVG
ncbi:hypothetical protein [Rhodococcus sp. IEGM 1330]|uniref:hypothetical protein n=1 Tax=Rhodococcus sp. IEGM 1330 TaxID=3082225 RepID=UPI00295548D5|nr:hypothetical protein [Rhodococcus sp. IEGM 1330]MDV8025071.1 hypothetical protein [Rhodococcus sp. IEGM 1330]